MTPQGDHPGRPLRVALLSTAAAGEPGSMAAYAQTLLHAFRGRSEVDVQLVCIGRDPGQGAWSRRMQTLALPLRAWRQRALKPDLWHVLDGSRAHVAAALAGSAPVLVTVHDIIPWLQVLGRFPRAGKPGTAARWLWRMNARAMRRAARLVCVSRRTALDVQACFGVTQDRCDVVPLTLRPALSGVAAEGGAGEREPGLVMHVGNNAFYKGRDLVLRIFAGVDPSIARRLRMLGPAPTPALRALAEGLGIAARVEWIVDPGDDRLVESYRRASLLLFPSRYEGFGWPVLEAMAFGLPVVCADRGSLPEVQADTGSCLDPDDVPGMAERVRAILRDPGLALASAAAGRTRVAEFGEHRFANLMLSAYARASAVAGRIAQARLT